MNTHESIRIMLPLAAAGALDSQQQLQVESHVRVCESCRLEMDEWEVVASGVRKLPQPVAPADLLARTQARVLRERAEAASMRWNG